MRDTRQVVSGANLQAHVAPLLRTDNGPDVGDGAREHVRRLSLADPLVSIEPVDCEPPRVTRLPKSVRVGNRVQANIAE